MNESGQPGCIDIEDITLTSSDEQSPYRINDIVTEFNIYESSEQPFMSADFIISDALALTTQVPITGGETIQITFKTPVEGMKENVFTKKFTVFAIKKFTVFNKARQADYVLRCYEAEYFKNITTRIQKSYSDMLVSDMVSDIAKKYLNIQDLKTNSQTTGKPTLIVPNMTPQESIQSLLCRYAKSAKYDVSNYIFFSNQDGYHFTSYEDLIDLNNKPSDYQVDRYTFREKNYSLTTPTVNDTNDNIKKENLPLQKQESGAVIKSKKPEEFLRIDDFEILNKMDIEKGLLNGLFDNTTFYINPTMRLYQKKDYNYLKDFTKFKHLSSKDKTSNPIIPESNDNFANLKGDSKHFLVMTNEENFAGNIEFADTRYNIAGLRHASIQNLNSVVVNLTIPGDNTRKTGDIIHIVFPEYGATDDLLSETDKFISGDYLVTAVRHVHNIKNGYFCILRCMKNCFENSIESSLRRAIDNQIKENIVKE